MSFVMYHKSSLLNQISNKEVVEKAFSIPSIKRNASYDYNGNCGYDCRSWVCASERVGSKEDKQQVI